MTTVDLDTCLMLIADQRRRHIIQQLRHDTPGQTAIDDLVTQLHQERSVSNADRSLSREQVSLQLYHSHLPKLADHGVVEYDSAAGTVRYQQHEQIETVLDALPADVPQTTL